MTTSKEDLVQFVKIHTRDLFAYTFSKVRQKEVAEDLVQETFISAYQSYGSFQGKSSIGTWLFSILKRKIADHYRLKYKNSSEVSSGIVEQFFDEDYRWKPEYRPVNWGNEKELLDDPDFVKALKECFEHLPEKWASAIQLKYLEEHDADGICKNLEITKSNFWQIIHRAKLQLRNCLEWKWFKK
ncbi:MAG TPA: sigma-70 family RNA polymerase sigma factor [Flavisolibacter sp.]|nr:sigma-70 family RNA polymerase sigma factor [Flavisolibacter sp.]HWJ91313.1 sigma-70 family RNA polymerase sigma factor [Flavisolibacter sp.]